LPGRVNWAIWILVCGLSGPLWAAGQDAAAPQTAPNKPVPARPAPESAPAAATKPPERPPEEVLPPLYYLPDQDGKLQAVPGFRFEDFIELYKLRSALAQPDRKPRYTMERLAISGTVAGEQADLTIQCTLRAQGDQPVRVPLWLNQGILRDRVGHEGPGQFLVTYEEQRDGYVCWLEGASGEHQHQLTARMLMPLGTAGVGRRLRLLVPRATASELKLKVPVAEAVARVSEGAALLAPRAVGRDATELTVVGLAGEVEVAWWAAEAKPTEPPAELEAIGAVLARIDGRQVASEATLTVRSYGGSFDRFRVRLPRGAELVPGSSLGYTVARPDVQHGAGDAARTVEVQLAKKTAGPVEVQLSARQPYDSGKGWQELSGFEVIEAARQWGHLAVAPSGDWRLVLGPSRSARQVDQLPESLRSDDVAAGFEYFAQPYALSVRLAPRKTHLIVEPEYLVFVESDNVRLETRLKYTIHGAKVFALDLKLGDWQFDHVEPEQLVAVDAVAGSPSQTLSLPLQQPSTGQLELLLRAHRPLARGLKKLQFSLPQPVANTVGPASVAIIPADNVELTPDSQATTGLTREPVIPQMRLPQRQQEPFFYRGDSAKAVFAAEVKVHPRSVAVELTSRIQLDAKAAQVAQTFRYAIAYEPLDRLSFEVPQALAGPGAWTAELNGQKLVPVLVPERGARPLAPGAVRMAVVLPQAFIGACQLLVRHATPMTGSPPPEGVPLAVPLVMPLDAKLSANRLELTAPPGLDARPQEQQAEWKPSSEERPGPGLLPGAAWECDGPAGQVVLRVSGESASGAAQTVIEQAWIQTWLTQTARQDRAVLRFRSDQPRVRLRVPVGAAVNLEAILLDGKPVPAQPAGDNGLTVDLGGPSRPWRVLELGYHFPAGRAPRGTMEFEFPQIEPGAWFRRLYWQLILPPAEHLVWAPPGLTREETWAWGDWGWPRRPTLDQPELEAWIGAAEQTPPPDGANQYLFSGMGRIDAAEVSTAGRSWIVLICSGATLIAGLLLIYVPGFRHPAALLLAAVALVAAGAIWPEPTRLLAQAGGLGLMLSLMAGLLQRAMGRRRGLGDYAEASRVMRPKEAAPVQTPPGGPANPVSTQTAPALLPPATLEWNV